MKGKKLLLVFVSFVMLVTVAACSSSKADNPARRISATIKAGFPANTQNSKARSAAAVVGTAAEVTSITVDVQDGSGAFVVQGVHLANNNGTWSGMINDIPAGEQLTFTGHAFNGSSQEIFTGIATPVLSGTNAQVTLPLAPVSNNTALQFLNITQIGRPARIAASTTAPVSIVVTGNTNETLSYVITPAADGGTFDSISGSVTLNGNLAAIPFVYTAPGAAGTFTHGVEVVDSRGSSVETTFTTQVVSQLASAETLVQFNPVITALVPTRTGSDVTFYARVSDTAPLEQLSYSWSFDGGLSFVDAGTNPAVLQGYNENTAGTLTLTIANGERSTTVTYAIEPGQFPASVESDLLILPQTLNTINYSTTGDTSVSGNIIALTFDEYGDQTDYNGDGDTEDSVVGYYDLNSGTAVNTGIPADAESIGGDIIAFRHAETGTLGYYSISSYTWTDTGIALSNFRNGDSNRFVSNGKIAFVAAIRDLNGDGAADLELCIYDTTSDVNTTTGVLAANDWDFNPSFSGDIVAFQNTAGNIGYYNVVTQQVNDTLIPGNKPSIDNGIIAFNSGAGYVAYYVIATNKYVLTPLTDVDCNPMPSISDGIIAISADEWVMGDLNGDKVAADPIVVLYDIPTGRVVSTGLKKRHWGEISNGMIEYIGSESDYNQDLNGDGDLDDRMHMYAFLSDLTRSYFGR